MQNMRTVHKASAKCHCHFICYNTNWTNIMLQVNNKIKIYFKSMHFWFEDSTKHRATHFNKVKTTVKSWEDEAMWFSLL